MSEEIKLTVEQPAQKKAAGHIVFLTLALTIFLPFMVFWFVIKGTRKTNTLGWIIYTAIVFVLFDFTVTAFGSGGFIPSVTWSIFDALPAWAMYVIVYGIGVALLFITALAITLDAKRTIKAK